MTRIKFSADFDAGAFPSVQNKQPGVLTVRAAPERHLRDRADEKEGKQHGDGANEKNPPETRLHGCPHCRDGLVKRRISFRAHPLKNPS